MNLLQSIKLAAKSLGARKGRTFLSMLGVIIGLAAVIILVTYTKGTTKQMMEMLKAQGTNQIQVQAYKWTTRNDDDSVFQAIYNYCKQLSDMVDGVTPQQNFYGTVRYNTKSSDNMSWDDPLKSSPQIYMGSDQWSACNNAKIVKGRDLTYLDVKSGSLVCVLSELAAKNFFDYADPIGKEMTFDGLSFKVIGVYGSRFDLNNIPEGYEWQARQENYIVIPYTTSRALKVAGSYGVDNWSNQFVVKCKSSEATIETQARLETFLKTLVGDPKSGSQYGGYSIYSQDQAISSTEDANKSQQMLLGGIAAISLLVGGIGIMNIMLVTVTERTREIGIRKAIGAERKSIIIQFLIEACMICGIGGLLGIAVGYAGSLIVCKATLNLILLPDTGITVGSFAISVGLGIIFGLYPAVKASGLQPVEALRAE